jgi:hypothetical protein
MKKYRVVMQENIGVDFEATRIEVGPVGELIGIFKNEHVAGVLWVCAPGTWTFARVRDD